MPACPAGHESAASDYCDVCGLSITAQATPSAVQRGAPCPRCAATVISRFCEACGFDTDSRRVAGTLVEPETAWTAIITASRAHYDSVLAGGGLDPSEVPFPADYPERRISLSGDQLRIGRRSVSREVRPEIDLTGPPADPAISRLHAVLVAQPDGSWAVIDPGSENGTSVNGAELDVGDAVPLHDGDCISLGAWTAITILGGNRD
jgi:hypothetical protein